MRDWIDTLLDIFGMTVVIIFIAMLLFSAGCAPTAAGLRRDTGRHLAWCLSGARSPAMERQCVAEAEALCALDGLEPTCGVDELWTMNRPTRVR